MVLNEKLIKKSYLMQNFLCKISWHHIEYLVTNTAILMLYFILYSWPPVFLAPSNVQIWHFSQISLILKILNLNLSKQKEEIWHCVTII